MTNTRWSWTKCVATIAAVCTTGGAAVVGIDQAWTVFVRWKARTVELQADIDTSYLDLDLRHADDMAEANERIESLERRVAELMRINYIDPATVPGLTTKGN